MKRCRFARSCGVVAGALYFFLVNLTGGGEPVGAIEGLAQKFATDAARFQFVPHFQAAVAAVAAQVAFGKAGVALPAAFREGFENGGDVFGGKFAQFGGKLGAAVFAPTERCQTARFYRAPGVIRRAHCRP